MLGLCGCTDRALTTPTDAGVDLASIDLAGVDLAVVDLSDLALVVDLAYAPPDLSHAPPLDLSGPSGPGPEHLVYAHSDQTLFSVDPTSLAVTWIGEFNWPQGPDQMTDIALDRYGHMMGISYSTLYAIDPSNAKCTFLAFFTEGMNALSFVAGSAADAGADETLLGAGPDGSVYRIDPVTGAQTWLGYYGNERSSSGDLVSIEGATYATVLDLTDSSDVLVKVDPSTGAATEIGATGTTDIWGLGYWDGKLFGFTASNGIVDIDIGTGKATPIPGTDSFSFWGAGVITNAPTSN
jgi:hypothetical protein